MSEIKAIERLRELSKEVVDYRWGVEFDRAVDALEAEIAERFVELPVDADGVPIHVGDSLELGNTHGCVISLTYSPKYELPWEWQCDTGEWYSTAFAHHYEPRTLEDVLADLQQDTLTSQGEYSGEVISSEVWERQLEEQVRNAADEIREIIGEEC